MWAVSDERFIPHQSQRSLISTELLFRCCTSSSSATYTTILIIYATSYLSNSITPTSRFIMCEIAKHYIIKCLLLTVYLYCEWLTVSRLDTLILSCIIARTFNTLRSIIIYVGLHTSKLSHFLAHLNLNKNKMTYYMFAHAREVL